VKSKLGRATGARRPDAMIGVLCTLAFVSVGCGGNEWLDEANGFAALTDDSTIMDSVLVPVPVPPEDPSASGALGGGGEPRIVYLHYADGTPLPKTDVNACKGTPPAFKCAFATTLAECQRQIQVYLDKWYADTNVIFTLNRPTSGKFYTVVVTSGGGAWCDLDAKVAGVAPFLCKDLHGGVAYAFLGGENAKQTAIIIAQEQAHLVGLEHTNSERDLLYPTICRNCDGFENVTNDVKDDKCNRPKQNSYALMKERLGAWPGGTKPTIFGCRNDATAPVVKIMEPADEAAVTSNFTVRVDARDDCDVSKVEVAVSPQVLNAMSMAPPFQWDLTNISGRQTITVTAYDAMGHKSSATVSVTAPLEFRGVVDEAARMKKTGACSVSGGAPGGTGGAWALAALLGLLVRRRRR
jgi:MYXO-CTERM domain-containing protein